MRKSYHARGIVLDATKLGEQDLILTMLAQDGRRLSVVARGARKPGGRFASISDLFCVSDMLLVEGRNLDVVAEAHLVEAYEGLRYDYDRMCYASAVAEVARYTCFEEHKDEILFALLTKALATIAEVAPARAGLISAAYIFKVLAHSGWYPDLYSCVACGDEALTHFSAVDGGALCASCAHSIEGALAISADTLSWLRAFLGCTFEELAAPTGTVAPEPYLYLAYIWATSCLEVRLDACRFVLNL